MITRLERFQQFLAATRMDAYLVTHDVDISYLAQYPSADSWLLVLPEKVLYLTDARYADQARHTFRGVKVCQYKQSLVEEVFHQLRHKKTKKVHFDSRHLSLAVFHKLKKSCPPGVKLVTRNGVVQEMRQVKEPSEVAQIRACLKLTWAGYAQLASLLRPGVSERDLLKALERFVWKKEVKFSFPPIIASGANAAWPHARVSDRKFLKNDLVLVDWGIDQGGYKSDLTRIFFLGKIPPLIKERYKILNEAQAAAIARIRPGVAAAEIDSEARKYLEKKKLARYFTHSLGHGVGLEVHEAPRISKTSPVILKEGMVFTVEPGIYFPGQYGLRIEDMVFVTQDGCEVLSRSSLKTEKHNHYVVEMT